MSKRKQVKMPISEFVKEHKKLVRVLRSPSHTDDKKEADDQEKELKEYTEKSDYSTESVGCGSGISGKICSHNRSKLHKFVKAKKSKLAKNAPKGVDPDKYDRCVDKVKRKRSAKNAYAVCGASLQGDVNKSVDFQNAKVSVDAADQLLAEATANKKLIGRIQDAVFQDSNVTKIQLSKGVLTLSKKDEGLYDGFFQDSQGQVVEKFDNMTPAIIAKNLEMKNLEPAYADPTPAHSSQEEAEDRIIAQQEAIKVVESAHQRIDRLEREMEPKKVSLRVRLGDFEIELRKSVKAFVQDFKKGQDLEDDIDEEIVSKAVHSWYKQNQERIGVSSFAAGVKELYDNWETHKEGFYQTVYALEQVEESNE